MSDEFSVRKLHIITQLAICTTSIPLIVLAFWGVKCYIPPFFLEPETTIESWESKELYHGLNKGRDGYQLDKSLYNLYTVTYYKDS